MKVREHEPWRRLFSSGLRVFDLYDLMDRAGTYTFRLTKRYINIPLTAAATGVLGDQVGSEAFDWEKLIYTPLIITAAICLVGVALKVPNFLSAAKRKFTRLQGQVNMVQLKRNRRLRHAEVLWRRHFVYHTRELYSEEAIEAAEGCYAESRARLVQELDGALSEESVDHLELENLGGRERREAVQALATAMEYESPTTPGVERCESGFRRTLMYSLRSDDSQRETQERSGYDFREYKTWLRQTFFDHTQPPFAAHAGSDYRLGSIRAQLRRDGVGHDAQVREDWYVFPGLAQRFWHANTIRKVSLKVGAALSRLSRKYRRNLAVQAMLWPGNWRREAFQVRTSDGDVLAEELHASGRRIVRQVYGENRCSARLMLDRAMLNNFIESKGLRVLADYAYCCGEGMEQDYVSDLQSLGCSGRLLAEHSRFVENARASMAEFLKWLADARPALMEDEASLSLLKDAFHRNWRGLREAVPGKVCGHNLYGFSMWRRLHRGSWAPADAGRILEEFAEPECLSTLRAERDAIRMFDAVAHLEYDTYADLIEQLAEFEG